MGAEIGGHAFSRGFHCLFSLLPVGRADISVFFSKLQGMEDAQGLVDASAEGQIVDHLMTDDTLAIDKEKPAQGDTGGEEDLIGAGNRFIEVGDQRISDIAYAAVVDMRLFPGKMGKGGIDGYTDELAVVLGKFPHRTVKGKNLRGADKGEIEGIKKQQDIFAAIIGQAKILFEGIVGHNCGGGEIRGWLGN